MQKGTPWRGWSTSDTTYPFLSGDQCGIQRWGRGWWDGPFSHTSDSQRVTACGEIFFQYVILKLLKDLFFYNYPKKTQISLHVFLVSWVRSVFFVLISLFSCGCCFNKQTLWISQDYLEGMIGGTVTWARHENEDYGASTIAGKSTSRMSRCIFVLKMGDFSDVMWIFLSVGVLHLASFEGRLQAVKIAERDLQHLSKKDEAKHDGLISNTV